MHTIYSGFYQDKQALNKDFPKRSYVTQETSLRDFIITLLWSDVR